MSYNDHSTKRRESWIDRGEIASAGVQCGNRSPPFLFHSLSDPTSPSTPFSLPHFRVSSFSLSRTFSLHSAHCTNLTVSFFLDLLVFPSILSPFFAKFNFQFSLYELLYSSSVKSVKSFVLLLVDSQIFLWIEFLLF